MRLLIYCDDPGYGGTAVNAGLIAAGLAERGIQIFLAASADISGNAPGVTFLSIDYDTMRFHDKTRRSRNEPESLLASVRPELVLFCDGAPDSSLAAKAVCRDWGLPFVVHTNYVAASHAADLADCRDAVAQCYHAAAAVVAVSQENLALLRMLFAVPAARSGVILNGRPKDFFEPVDAVERQQRRDALGLAPTDLLCLTVARFEPRKGYRHLLRAVSLLSGHPAGARLRFVAIGHDPSDGRRDLETQLAASGLSGRLTVLGERGDVRQWLGAADCFVLPSESEGMPLCLIEAMGQGLPVIASAVSGIPEQIGAAGILLPDPNVAPEATVYALARALLALDADPEARIRLGQAAKDRALRHFTTSAMFKGWAGLLQSLAPAVSAATPRFPDPAGHTPPHTVPLGRIIDLGDDQACMEYLKNGWSHGEGEGRWALGQRARLDVWLPPAARRGFVLELEAWPFRGWGEAPVALDVTVCGQCLGRFAWPGAPERLSLVLACLPPLGSSGLLPQQATIVFSIEGATTPASWGLSDDARPLGLFVKRLSLDPLAGGPC